MILMIVVRYEGWKSFQETKFASIAFCSRIKGLAAQTVTEWALQSLIERLKKVIRHGMLNVRGSGWLKGMTGHTCPGLHEGLSCRTACGTGGTVSRRLDCWYGLGIVHPDTV